MVKALKLDHQLATELVQQLIQMGKILEYHNDAELLAHSLTLQNFNLFKKWQLKLPPQQRPRWTSFLQELKTQATGNYDEEQNLYTLLQIDDFQNQAQLWQMLNHIDWMTHDNIDFGVNEDDILEINCYLNWARECEENLVYQLF